MRKITVQICMNSNLGLMFDLSSSYLILYVCEKLMLWRESNEISTKISHADQFGFLRESQNFKCHSFHGRAEYLFIL